MRDLEDYQKKYRFEPGEKTQVLLRRKHVIEIMEKYPHDSIIEIGCGLEPLFMHFSDYKKMAVVEPGHDFVTRAKKLAEKHKEKIVFFEGCFEEISSKNIEEFLEYNYIIVSSLVHELEKPTEFMKSLYRVCNKKAIIHINVPNANSLHRLIAVKMGIVKDTYELSNQQVLMQRNKVYDMESIISFVTQCGFEVIEKGSFIPKFLTGAQMDKMLECNIVDEEYYRGLDQIIDCFPENGSEIYVQIRKSEK